MMNKTEGVKEFDIHLTKACTGMCDFCYATHKDSELMKLWKPHGDTETLMTVIRNIRVAGGAEDVVFVGGDPCQHPDIIPLLEYAKEVGLHTCVLSNTHLYRHNGILVPMEKVVKIVDEMDFTLHGTPRVHDAFNGNKGAYESAVSQLKEFVALRGDDQEVGVVVNLTPEVVEHLDETLRTFFAEVPLDPKRDHILVQRIAPVGRAAENFERWKITPEMLVKALEEFEKIQKEFGIEVKLDAVDVFPWCVVPEKYHYMLTPGGCQWGQPGGVLSVLPDGGIQRCALSGKVLGNICSLTTPEQFREFFENDPTLKAFREKQHLYDCCKKCKYFEQCGGGCVIATGGDPYGEVPYRGIDYLA